MQTKTATANILAALVAAIGGWWIESGTTEWSWISFIFTALFIFLMSKLLPLASERIATRLRKPDRELVGSLNNKEGRTTNRKEIHQLITEAYSRDQQKPELMSFKEVSRRGRKYGFTFVCTLADKSEAEQIHWAASLLVEVAGSWPRDDLPELLIPEVGSLLANDAMQLIANGLGAMQQLAISHRST